MFTSTFELCTSFPFHRYPFLFLLTSQRPRVDNGELGECLRPDSLRQMSREGRLARAERSGEKEMAALVRAERELAEEERQQLLRIFGQSAGQVKGDSLRGDRRRLLRRLGRCGSRLGSSGRRVGNWRRGLRLRLRQTERTGLGRR